MPYFGDLERLMAQVSLWADLRHEQGAAAKPVVKRLRKELERALRKLENAEPKKKIRWREPNGLESIRLLRPEGPRKLWPRLRTKGLASRMRGAWLGRAAGCTLGAPVENWSLAAMEALAQRCAQPFPPEDYWAAHPTPDEVRYGLSPMRDYLRDGLHDVPVDDDVTYTVLGLLILETFGPEFTTTDVGAAWLKWLPVACTAEAVALENLKAGVPAPDAAENNNPYQEWIGADIRSDPWAYALPGWPEKAAEWAWRDAYLSHRGNGIYGAMFFAAAIAAAFAVNDPTDALAIGLTEIPDECRLARDVRWALEIAPALSDWRAARAAVDARFAGMHPVHTNNNACLTVFALYLGQKDFTRTIGMAVAMGLDNDCTAATAGSLLGAIIGVENIPEHWWKPFRNRTRTYLNNLEYLSNEDLVKRFLRLARQNWQPPTPPDAT
jgi:ADP-ribosylglycohydrolase